MYGSDFSETAEFNYSLLSEDEKTTIVDYIYNKWKMNKPSFLKTDFSRKDVESVLFPRVKLDEADIAFASGVKGLNETNKMIIKNTLEALLAKQEKDEKGE